MPCRHEELEEEWDDDDADDSEDDEFNDDDEAETAPCPYCRRPVYEEAERCPHCGKYISGEDAPPSPKPWWIIIGVGLCLIVIYGWLTCR